jgi:hypothetical protein
MINKYSEKIFSYFHATPNEWLGKLRDEYHFMIVCSMDLVERIFSI